MYRSSKDCVLRAVEFVCAADPQVLLVVETLLLKREAKRKRHFLLAAEAEGGDVGRADSCRVEQRERLTTWPTARDEEHLMQLHAMPDGPIICDMSKSNQIELFDTSSASTSTQQQATANCNQKLLRLHFMFFSFALCDIGG